jgi:hypothetical protein
MRNAVMIAVERVGGPRGAAYLVDLSEAMIRHMMRVGLMANKTPAARERVRRLAEASGVPALALLGLMPDWQPEGEEGGGATRKRRGKAVLRVAETLPARAAGASSSATAAATPSASWRRTRLGRVCRPPTNDQRVRELSSRRRVASVVSGGSASAA